MPLPERSTIAGVILSDDEAEPVIRCRKGRTSTIVEFDERVGDADLFRRVGFAADVALTEEERQRLEDSPKRPEGG